MLDRIQAALPSLAPAEQRVGTVNEGVPFIHRSVASDDKTADVKYRNEAGALAMDRALVALMAAYEGKHRIQFFGVGNSGVVAQDAQHQ